MMDEKPQPHTNGVLNGSNVLNGVSAHTATVAPRRSIHSKRRRGVFYWSLSVIARLLTWYSIFTILFSCPDSLDACDETSPRVCKPYFHVKHAVSPHVSPYYDAYAAPYIELARPYYDTFDSKVITPGRLHVIKYAGPRLSQVKAHTYAQWERSVQPQILKYQALVRTNYDHIISPYIDEAATIIAPYYDSARTYALLTYHEILVPAYTFARPYTMQGYDVAYGFTKYSVIPSTIWLWNKTYTFIDSSVWPHLRDVYFLKVEPQLLRIGERLGRYKEKRTKPVVEEVEPDLIRSTFVKPTPSVPATALPNTRKTTQVASRATNGYCSPGSTASISSRPGLNVAPKSKDKIREEAAKTVADDLSLWEGKFSQVVEQGASELEDRVEEISSRMIETHAKTAGKILVSQLETTVRIELESLKGAILHILENTKRDTRERDEKFADAVRGAGLNIRSKAQNIRDWRQGYDQETETAITKAAEEHFSILEQTRDLALQKIGMKWAWMDGVTYKDWQKYHQLKDRFEGWTEDLKRLITTHPGLARAQSAGTDIEDEGMDIAHEAAMELGRLKQVAAWKAIAEDFTDDFDSGAMQSAAEAAKERAATAETATEENTTNAHGIDETSTEKMAVSPEYNNNASSISDAEETHSGQTQEDLDASASPTVGIRSTEPEDRAADLSPEQSGPEKSSKDPNYDISEAEPFDSLHKISSSTDESKQMGEDMQSPDSPIHSVNEEAPSTTVKSALFGVAAEPVPTKQPDLENDDYPPSSIMLSVTQSDDASASMATTNSQLDITMKEASSSEDYATPASSIVSSQYAAVSSHIAEPLFGKDPSSVESEYSQLSEAYESDIPLASSSSSADSTDPASKAMDASTGLGSSLETAASSTASAKDTTDQANDEL
ncbi:hypothetical protein GGS21DRAFT_199416 [Xylaria nigripes]|nr:hypothetical protein GGS21DRAFT_199416 [Xylaria nigripes]